MVIFNVCYVAIQFKITEIKVLKTKRFFIRLFLVKNIFWGYSFNIKQATFSGQKFISMIRNKVSKYDFRNTFRVSNSCDQDHARHSIRPDLGQN